MKQNITDWDLEDRPREKFAAHGAKSLSKAELLAILIGSGSTDDTAVSLMKRIMSDCGNSISALGRMDVAELCQYKGIGLAKAVTLLAACELSDRRLEEDHSPARISSSTDIYNIFRPKLANLPHEESHVLLLNQRLGVIGTKLVGQGGLTGTMVDVRIILKAALLANATNIALCHNHPAGTLRPSRDDDRLTESVRKGAETVNIRLVDHVIVTAGGYYSYSDQGLI